MVLLMLFSLPNASLILGWFLSSFILLFLFLVLELFFSDPGVPCFVLELVELGLLRWVDAGGGSEHADGPAGGAGDAMLVVVFAGVGASRHAAAGGGVDRVGASAEEAGSDWLVEVLAVGVAEGAGGVSLVVGPAWVGVSRTTAAWGGGDPMAASEVEAGGELLDAGPADASASRPIAAGGGGERVLEHTEGAGSDAGPAGWAGGERLDAGATGACASRPTVAGGGGGIAL